MTGTGDDLGALRKSTGEAPVCFFNELNSHINSSTRYLCNIGIKRVCKVLKKDVSAETLEQLLDVLLQGRAEGTTTEHDEEIEGKGSVNLMKWLKEIVKFDRFSLTIRLLNTSMLKQIVEVLDSLPSGDSEVHLVREAFTN